MKKRMMLFILAVAMPVGSIFAQLAYDHWSIQAKGGVNTIRGLYRSNWDRDINAEVGGAIEYTFSPLIGLGVEYLYLNNNHSWKKFTSKIHQTTIFTSLNLSNLTVPYRSGAWKRFNTYFNLGVGFGFGDFVSTDTTVVDRTGDVMNLTGVLGINFEYNVSPNLAIGIEPQFFSNTNSKFNPAPFQVNEKAFYTLNLNVRYKITGSKPHIRNQNYADYQLDQIESTERYRKQQAALKAGMQQLVVDHATSEAIVIDSLYKETVKADSAIIKLIYTIKDTVKAVPATQIAKPVQAVEPIVEETSENASISTKPVSVRKETYRNTAYCHALLKEFSVVVGSFSSKENADKLASKLKDEGHAGLVIQNEQGLYRVISLTDSNIDVAISQVKKMRARYPDAWIAKCVLKE
jgi:cell division septation protein DedD